MNLYSIGLFSIKFHVSFSIYFLSNYQLFNINHNYLRSSLDSVGHTFLSFVIILFLSSNYVLLFYFYELTELSLNVLFPNSTHPQTSKQSTFLKNIKLHFKNQLNTFNMKTKKFKWKNQKQFKKQKNFFKTL